jgi:signal transduction histidine kinase
MRAVRDTAYLLLGIATGTVAFVVWVCGMSLSLGLIVLIVGIPVLVGTLVALRWMADVERWRAAIVLGAPLEARYAGPGSGSLRDRMRAVVHDAQTWKDFVYLLVLFPITTAWGSVALAGWAYAVGSITLPVWFWALPDDGHVHYGLFTVVSRDEAWLAVPVGIVLVPVMVVVVRALAASQLWFARLMLAPGREAALEERVEELTATRAGAVDAAASELHRIERDLHDGAQARLVALAMDLGMAEERFERDPDGARELIGDAREEARRALGELRDLARGIRPGLLAERGLGPAIAELAARSPVPATASVEVDGRLPAPVEAAAWFVVSEALANAGKHSGASRVTIGIARRDGALDVDVADDGRGGADARGAGLSGLAARVAALDGHLAVDSPPGGPTHVRATIPVDVAPTGGDDATTAAR